MKRVFAAVTVLPVLFFAAGCWDNKELDTIAIVTGMGIDSCGDGDEAEYTFQIGSVTNSSSSSENKSSQNTAILLKRKDKGVLQAIDALVNENNRNPFMHHNQAIIVCEELAKKGINPYMDAFLREREMRMESWLLVAEGKASDVLSVELEQEDVTSIGLDQIMENRIHTSKHLGVNLLQFTTKILDKTTSPVVPIIKVSKENDKEGIKITEMGVFKEDKMIGKLTEGQVKGFVWVMGDLSNMKLDLFTEQGYANAKMFKITHKSKPVLENGKPVFIIEINGTLLIDELQGFKDMKLNECIELLEKAAVKEIEYEIADCLFAAQQMKADIFGFGTAFYRRYPKEWKTIKKDWDNLFAEMDVRTKIQATIVSMGKIVNSLDLKEEDEDEN